MSKISTMLTSRIQQIDIRPGQLPKDIPFIRTGLSNVHMYQSSAYVLPHKPPQLELKSNSKINDAHYAKAICFPTRVA